MPQGRKREREAAARKTAKTAAKAKALTAYWEAWEAKEERKRETAARRERRDEAFKNSLRVAEKEGHPDPLRRAKFVAVYMRDKVRAKLGKPKKVFEKGPRQTKL